MIRIIDGRLFQWDTARKCETIPREGETVDEVHFYNGTTENALVGVISGGVSEIPNIFLQAPRIITIYAVMINADGERTTETAKFPVEARPKPDGYVYTETEVATWASFDERLKKVEENGKITDEDIAAAVGAYLDEKPVAETDPTVPEWAKAETKPTYTAAEVGAQIADFVVMFEQNEPYTADKTFEETKAAYEAGATIVGVMGGVRYEMYSDGGGEGFGFINRVTTDTGYKMIWLWEGDSVTFRSASLYISHPVQSVNGKTGAVSLTASDVGALPDTTAIPTVPTNVSAFTNDAGYAKTTDIPSVEGLATEKYVDDAIAGVDIPEADVPSALPNPNALTFTGAVEATYDGSEAVSVDIPSGGGGGVVKTVLMDVTTTEEVSQIKGEALGAEGVAVLLEADEVWFYLEQVPTADETITSAGSVKAGVYKPGWYSYGVNLWATIGIQTPIYGQTYNGRSLRFFKKIATDKWEYEITEASSSTSTTNGSSRLYNESFLNLDNACYINAYTTTVFGVGTRFYVVAIKFTEG